MPTYDLEILVRTSKSGSGLNSAEKDVQSFSDKLGKAQNVAMNATKVFGAVAGGAAIAWKVIGEGAALEGTALKFDNLSNSIGTTSDLLIDELTAATKGTRSEMELMASAADFMGLGLAKNEEELVRMTRISGALGMNMNQLVLTLTNQTTMRFDALGVSVDGFDEKVQALEASGLSASAAFQEAFLQQAEDQILKVGDAADTTSGDMQKLTADFNNLKNGVLSFIAVRAGPAIGGLADYIDAVGAAQDDMNEAVELGIITQEEANNIVNLAARGHDTWQDRLREVRGEVYDLTDGIENANTTTTAYYIGMGELAHAEWEAATAGAWFRKITDESWQSANKAREVASEYTEQLREQRNELILAREEQEALTATTGDYFTTATEAFGTSDDIVSNIDAQNAALYASADAAGASATELAILGLATGALSEEQAIAALKSAALQSQILALGDAIANGMDPQEAINRLQSFQANLDAQDFTAKIGIDTEPAIKESDKLKEDLTGSVDEMMVVVSDLGVEFVTLSETAALEFDNVTSSSLSSKDDGVIPLRDSIQELSAAILQVPKDITITTHYVTEGSPPSGASGSSGSTGSTGNNNNIPEFATGGVVPGPIGSPVMALVHGGEEVLTPQQRMQSGVTIQNLNVTVSGGGTSRQTASRIASSVADELGKLS